MAAVTAPAGGSLLGKVRAVAASRRAVRGARPSAAAVFLAKAREHVVTLAALASMDLGAFQVHVPWLGASPGWAAVGASLLLADFAVRG